MAQRPLRAVIPAGAGVVALLLGAARAPQDPREEPGRTLDAALHHLGDDETPEWSEAPATPEALDRWAWRFQAQRNGVVRALAIRARDVDGAWKLRLNGTPLGALRGGDRLAEHLYAVPAGALRDGDNLLELTIATPGDDVIVGRVRLLDRGFREIHRLRPVEVRVRDAGSGRDLPARLAVVGPDGARPVLYSFGEDAVPVRPGVAYTDARGRARFEAPAGDWRVWAMHGTEWGVDSAALTIEDASAEPVVVDLRMQREVATPGFLAADTHVHTLTFSGHGDASVDERVLTLAAHGVEVAVATDHNHQTDYRPWMERQGVADAFRAVVGNEVTTEVGHFNAFPLDPAGPLPDHELRDWSALAADMRACGAEVVILNHPRWPDFERGPFGVFGLDRATGDWRNASPESGPAGMVEAARITVALPGAAAATLEDRVVVPLERSLSAQPGVSAVTSVCREGAGEVTVVLQRDADRAQVRAALAQALDGLDALPEGAAPPQVAWITRTKASLPVDAIEIFNSTYADSWEVVMEDWFALLNRGLHARGVGSSDSHTVGDVVGQGRTYVYGGTDDPLAAESSRLWSSFRDGRSTMSMGLYLETLSAGHRTEAPQTTATGERPDFRVRLAGASWAQATRVRVWWNGELVAERALEPTDGPHDRVLDFGADLPIPSHDGWIVCAADGPLPAGGWWDTMQEGVAAITNPIFVDVGGDGYRSPRAQATALWEAHRESPATLGEGVSRRNRAVAMQLAAILHEERRGEPFRSEIATIFEHAGTHGPIMKAWWEKASER